MGKKSYQQGIAGVLGADEFQQWAALFKFAEGRAVHPNNRLRVLGQGVLQPLFPILPALEPELGFRVEPGGDKNARTIQQ